MMIPRRQFISLFGGAAAWPSSANALQPGKLPTIGFMGPSAPSVAGPWLSAFVQRLRELGWTEGRSVVIEVRWADGRVDRLAEIAAEFVQLNVDVILTWASAGTYAAKQATSVIPVVFAVHGDPLGTGQVASLSRPGGNATGLSVQNVDLAGKRLELLREMVPALRRLAILVDSSPAAVLDARETDLVARRLDLDVTLLKITRSEDIVSAIASLRERTSTAALYVVGSPMTFTNRTRINTLALDARLPTIFSNQNYVAVGGLMSYGANFPDLFRRSAEYVDKILRGAKPADLPIEQPTKFYLVINLITAKALGLEVPPMLLTRADEVIE
jgi:putative ABC transport system substrate-binding protein